MLRVILRHTHNSLLFACILLLLCSFQRLCSYDFAQISTQANANLGEEGLQVDHFVFWGGAWEGDKRKYSYNPVSVGFSKFMSWANRYKPPILVAAPTTPEDVENLLINSATSLSQASLKMKRQIRHNKKMHDGSREDVAARDDGSESAASAKEKEAATSKPKIGFVLSLPSCDREAVVRWQKVWKEQALDQPFLFQILLGSNVEESCAAALRAKLPNTEDMIYYQIYRNDHMAMALQTCQNLNQVETTLEGLDEFLYYDASKAIGRLRSSATIRRFQKRPLPSSFQCTTGEPRKPAFCEDTVLDCPWFQYSPPSNGQEPLSVLQAAIS